MQLLPISPLVYAITTYIHLFLYNYKLILQLSIMHTRLWRLDNIL